MSEVLLESQCGLLNSELFLLRVAMRLSDCFFGFYELDFEPFFVKFITYVKISIVVLISRSFKFPFIKSLEVNVAEHCNCNGCPFYLYYFPNIC